MESKEPFLLNLQLEERSRLLIVEDDDGTRAVLTHFFSIRGYEVVSAVTGREALNIVERDPKLDIVLLDVYVPEVGGLEVLRQIKRMNPGLAVVLMTALRDDEIVQHGVHLGAFDCLLKPLDLLQLEATVAATRLHSEYQRQSWWRRFITGPAA